MVTGRVAHVPLDGINLPFLAHFEFAVGVHPSPYALCTSCLVTAFASSLHHIRYHNNPRVRTLSVDIIAFELIKG